VIGLKFRFLMIIGYLVNVMVRLDPLLQLSLEMQLFLLLLIVAQAGGIAN